MTDVVGSIQDAVELAIDQAAMRVGQARERADELFDQVHTSLVENPLSAIAGALAAGFVLAVLLSRPKVEVIYAREAA